VTAKRWPTVGSSTSSTLLPIAASTTITTPWPDLALVRVAAEERRRADARYVAAIRRARSSGQTYADIAEHAGVSDTAIRTMLRRHT
jgi:hypothetical protein